MIDNNTARVGHKCYHLVEQGARRLRIHLNIKFETYNMYLNTNIH
jgi:hypothetical protein